MQYMGSKRRIAKHIAPIIMGNHDPNNWYVEPFAGGMNMMENIQTPKRIAADSNPYVIALFQSLQNGWVPPDVVGEEMYRAVKTNRDQYPPELVGFVGFGRSFGGKFFGGYARNDLKNNYDEQSRTSVLKQSKKLLGVRFVVSKFDPIPAYIPYGSTVYCDPPYAGTTKYSCDLDLSEFWSICNGLVEQHGCRVFVSEYSAPLPWVPVWQQTVENPLNRSMAVEKLFSYGGVL